MIIGSIKCHSMKIGICGCSGRMGNLVERLSIENGHDVVAKINHHTSDILSVLNVAKPDICIDFSSPKGTCDLCSDAVQCAIPVVIGTTGLSENDVSFIKDCSRHIPILTSSNFSIGIHVMKHVVTEVTKLLPNMFDVEIIETHHNQKKDAPSGTALSLMKCINSVRSDAKAVFGRNGLSERKMSDVGMHSVRGGNVVGDHEVCFFGPNEELRIMHHANNREIFAMGALIAAEWLLMKNESGLFSLDDVFKLP